MGGGGDVEGGHIDSGGGGGGGGGIGSGGDGGGGTGSDGGGGERAGGGGAGSGGGGERVTKQMGTNAALPFPPVAWVFKKTRFWRGWWRQPRAWRGFRLSRKPRRISDGCSSSAAACWH